MELIMGGRVIAIALNTLQLVLFCRRAGAFAPRLNANGHHGELKGVREETV